MEDLIYKSNWDWNFERDLGLMTDELENKIRNAEFTLGEIAVFDSAMRGQTYISRVRKIHIEHPSSSPAITKATPHQKRLFYESGKREVVMGAFDYK